MQRRKTNQKVGMMICYEKRRKIAIRGNCLRRTTETDRHLSTPANHHNSMPAWLHTAHHCKIQQVILNVPCKATEKNYVAFWVRVSRAAEGEGYMIWKTLSILVKSEMKCHRNIRISGSFSKSSYGFDLCKTDTSLTLLAVFLH